MLHTVIASRRCGKTARLLATPTDPITPAAYLRLRREAAGLSRRDVADRLARLRLRMRLDGGEATMVGGDVDEALALVDVLETPNVRARHRATIAALAAVVPLDADVYHQLATEPADRHPTICLGCGCSAHDTCGGPDGVCSLSLRGICSRCIDRAHA